MKKIVSLILVLCFLVGFSACKGDTGDTTETTEGYVLPTPVINADFAFPYTSADKMTPYASESKLNRELIPIMYESLYISDESGKGIRQLSVSEEIEGKNVTVRLNQNVKFSDGTELVASDVKSSLEKAKSNVYYKGALSNVARAIVLDNYTITFELYRKDPFALNVLSFPVVKGDGKESVGTGKYFIDYLGDEPYFSVNKHHRSYNPQWNEQIALYDMSGINGAVYPFKANEISVFSNDLSDGEYTNLSSSTVSLDTNNLVYIGVNSRWAGSVASLAFIRQAINIGIDRKIIAASSFLGQGVATVTPYKNDFYELENMELVGPEGNVEGAIRILEGNGFDKFTDEGIRTNGSAVLRVNILVCTKNKYKLTVAESFKDALEKLGFGVTVTEKKKPKDFKAALKEGHFDFYVGETELTPRYDLSEFFSGGGSLNYGISESAFDLYSSLEKGEITTKQFVEGFSTEVPFLPLFYRKKVVSVNPNVKGTGDKYHFYSSVSDWSL